MKASVGENTTKSPFDSESESDSDSDRAQVQPTRIYALRSGDNKGTGISGALGAKQIIKLGPGWISESLLAPISIWFPILTTANPNKGIPHVYRSLEKEIYDISLVRCNISERGATNELMNLQVYILTFPSEAGRD